MLSSLDLLGRSTHCAAPLPPGLLQGELKVPFPCCQGLGHRDSGVGDFSKKRPGAGAWLTVCSEQEGFGLALGQLDLFFILNRYSQKCCSNLLLLSQSHLCAWGQYPFAWIVFLVEGCVGICPRGGPISIRIISLQGARLSLVMLHKESAVGAPTGQMGFMER